MPRSSQGQPEKGNNTHVNTLAHVVVGGGGGGEREGARARARGEAIPFGRARGRDILRGRALRIARSNVGPPQITLP